ncbi:hypothetical protein Naga_101172g2 [Nannochloropsis gaditana]|uniref:Uncharacterized protein n=1 Tax=Nannochloropsis gaditana TaxID=72520 RepID=W7TF41_9STRA|nr:hypothetical protein Naga_101172g2 [Nannochloropsis gaditana]
MEPGVEGLEEKVEREEGKEEKEEVEEVDDGQPQLLNYIGEGLEGDLFYESVRWQGQVFRMGDCVEVLLAGSGTEEAPRGFAEILWIWWASEGQEPS